MEQAAQVKTTREIVEKLTRDVARLEKENESSAELVQEAYADAARALLRMEDIGWVSLTGAGTLQKRYEIEQLHDISDKMREWTDTNPLLIRGIELRCSYVFGAGFKVGTVAADSKISARAQADIDDPINQANVFGPEALASNERARYTDGQVFAVYNRTSRRFQIVPLQQIEDAYTNPDDPGEVWFYLRTQTQRIYDEINRGFETVKKNEWIPVDTFNPPKGVRNMTELAKHKIRWDQVMVDSRVNRATGETWGLPDAFGAAPWAIAYSAYMRDGSKVLAALAEWVWQIKPKTKKSAPNTGAAVRSSDGPAKTIVSDAEITSLPRADAIDLTTGRPIAAQVASALGVSVVLLLSDPGKGGSYGTAETLTDPTIRTMINRREMNTQFLLRCLKLLGIKDPAIIWNKMAQDPDHREMQTRLAANGSGLFHEDEVRESIAELAGFTLKHDEPPEGYLIPNNAKSLPRKDIDGDASPMAKATGQGGAAMDDAKPSYADNSLRDDVDD